MSTYKAKGLIDATKHILKWGAYHGLVNQVTPTCDHQSPGEKGRCRKATEGSGVCDDRRKRSETRNAGSPESRRGKETLVHIAPKGDSPTQDLWLS